ncbi:MAG: acetyl-CoA C-acetyltransferase [Thiotrichales bacterium]
MSVHHAPNRTVYVVDGSRTPFLKARGRPGPFKAADLAVAAAKPLLLRQKFPATAFDQVILGCVMPSADEANIARVVALRLGCGHAMSAWTVQRNCASGMQAIDSAFRAIATGESELVLAGGVEAMSHAPLLWQQPLVEWFADWSQARGVAARVRTLARLKPGYLAPVIGLARGLRDPIVGLGMGQTAEVIAHRFNITRETMDHYAVDSHRRLASAQQNGVLDEIEPLFDVGGNAYIQDDGLRADSSVEKLARLPAAFDRKFGKVTAGNSAQISDGAAWLILASEVAIERHALPVLGSIRDSAWAGVDPREMGLGPVHAVAPLLRRNQMALSDIDYWELNEAFAGQVLACVAAWRDDDYCRDQLGLEAALGEVPRDRLNVDGGGISLGHPVGASGARITLHLLKTLHRTGTRRGIATLCIGGGQGGALLVESNPQ